MFKLLKFELKRAFNNIYFLIAVLSGCAIAIFDFFSSTYPALWLNHMPKMEYPMSLFSEYIGLRAGSLAHTLIFLLAPLICSLPHADSLAGDLGDGYSKNIVIRGDIRKWLTAKYIAVFLSGAAVFVIPFLANLLVTAMFVPAAKPIASTKTFAAARAVNPFADIFLDHPMLYIIMFLIIGAVIIGLFCEIALLASLLVKSRFSSLLSPFILYMLCYIFSSIFGNFSFDPYYIILPTQTVPTFTAEIILLPIALFLVTFIPVTVLGSRKDVL